MRDEDDMRGIRGLPYLASESGPWRQLLICDTTSWMQYALQYVRRLGRSCQRAITQLHHSGMPGLRQPSRKRLSGSTHIAPAAIGQLAVSITRG